MYPLSLIHILQLFLEPTGVDRVKVKLQQLAVVEVGLEGIFNLLHTGLHLMLLREAASQGNAHLRLGDIPLLDAEKIGDPYREERHDKQHGQQNQGHCVFLAGVEPCLLYTSRCV